MTKPRCAARWVLLCLIGTLAVALGDNVALCDTPRRLENTCWVTADASEILCVRPQAIEVTLGKSPPLTLQEGPARRFTFADAPGREIRAFTSDVARIYSGELDAAVQADKTYPSLMIRDADRSIALVLIEAGQLLKLEQSRADPPSFDRYVPATGAAPQRRDIDLSRPPR